MYAMGSSNSKSVGRNTGHSGNASKLALVVEEVIVENEKKVNAPNQMANQFLEKKNQSNIKHQTYKLIIICNLWESS